jgi:MFS family permease
MTTPVSASRTPLYLTFGLMLFGFCSINAARVTFSLYALHLNASPTAVGLLVGTFYVFPVLISWPVGRYSDRVGSRGLLLAGAAFGIAAMLIPFVAGTLAALFVAATLMGIAFTLYNVLLPNLVGLLSTPQDRVRNFSNSSLVGGVSMVLGPLLAGFAIDLAGHAYACLYLVSLTLIVAALVAFGGKRLPGGTPRAAAATAGTDPLANRDMVRVLAVSSLVQVGQDLYQFYIPVHGHAAGLSASAIGGVLSLYAAASFVVRLIMPYLVGRLGDERVLRYSFCFAAVGFVLAPFSEGVVALAAVSFLFGLGIGCGQPITTLLIFSRSPEGRSGETFGLRQTVNNVLRISCPPLFGLVATAFGLPAVFFLSAAMMGGGSALARPGTEDKQERR